MNKIQGLADFGNQLVDENDRGVALKATNIDHIIPLAHAHAHKMRGKLWSREQKEHLLMILRIYSL